MIGRTVRRVGYRRTRLLLLLVGLSVLAVLAVLTYIRRIETAEVVGVLLFIPVFVAALFRGAVWGAIVGVIAAGVYVLLRLPAIEAAGLGDFLGLIVTRGLALIAFGILIGWAATQMVGSIRKLEEHDQIDDETSLLNARFFLQETDLELARSRRYQTIFSVSTVEFGGSAIDGSARQATRSLRDLARELQRSVRSVDRVVHALDGNRHTIAVILPETGAEGAAIFTARLVERVAGKLGSGATGVTGATLTLPEDEEGLEALRAAMRRVDAAEHPEPEAQSAGG
jgi:hypothetical protein